MAKKPKRGRPARYQGERLSKNRTFRVRDRLDEMLMEAAARTGRSVSEEVEHRLERSFFDDRQSADLMGSHVAGEILRLVRAVMMFEGLGLRGDWAEDRLRSERVRLAVNGIVAALCGLEAELPADPELREWGNKVAAFLLDKSSSPWLRPLPEFKRS
jgi:hypothetical protein